jgi:protein-L-isoaspartate O-methyltransferase
MFSNLKQHAGMMMSIKKDVDQAMKSIPRAEFLQLAMADDDYQSLGVRVHAALPQRLREQTSIEGITMALRFNKKRVKKMVKSYQ